MRKVQNAITVGALAIAMSFAMSSVIPSVIPSGNGNTTP